MTKLPTWKKSKVKKVEKWKKVKKSKELVLTWIDRGWTAQVIQNEDGGGWAVTMTRDGDSKPVYVAPWTMGRNKVDPKPLSQKAFNTWVKSASEFLMRSQHQTSTVDRLCFDIATDDDEKLKIIFDVNRGDYLSVGVLTAEDIYGDEIARSDAHPKFVLTIESAEEWVRSGFVAPPPPDDPIIAQRGDPAWEDDVWDPDAEASEDDDDGGEELTYTEETFTEAYEEPVFEYD
ncbi:MAG: hypothetical protein ACI8S6_003720 [Myxococcota bacterium]|jgi:hypothetical protein